MKNFTVKAFITLLLITISVSDLFAQTRIRFARGRTSATVSGKIFGNAERKYVLGARYGQYLSANISSRNGCAVFRNGATSVSYRTERGDNYLYLLNNCGRQTTYTLTVSIN